LACPSSGEAHRPGFGVPLYPFPSSFPFFLISPEKKEKGKKNTVRK
jgi:hypothetical protein